MYKYNYSLQVAEGARIRKASRIIGVDINPSKNDLGLSSCLFVHVSFCDLYVWKSFIWCLRFTNPHFFCGRDEIWSYWFYKPLHSWRQASQSGNKSARDLYTLRETNQRVHLCQNICMLLNLCRLLSLGYTWNDGWWGGLQFWVCRIAQSVCWGFQEH